MNIQQAYNIWATQYDSNINLTRDLEAKVIKEALADVSFDNCLEIGCGTGKNTEWLITKSKQITAVDFSDEMLSKAKEKIKSEVVDFRKGDINKDWTFVNGKYDLVTFSLVLEHIENLPAIFEKLSHITALGGHVYIGELHPFKQYAGSKARFETESGTQVLTCFNHHITDFIQPAKQFGFTIEEINEHFDNNDRATIPRILSLLLVNG